MESGEENSSVKWGGNCYGEWGGKLVKSGEENCCGEWGETCTGEWGGKL